MMMKVGERPSVGETAEARVGDVLYEKFDYRTVQAWRLSDPFKRDYNWCLGCSIDVPAGTLLELGPTTAELCTVDGFVQPKFGPPVIVCFERHPTKSELVRFRVPGTLGGILNLASPLRFEETEVMSGEGFKAELVYQGLAGDVVRLLYREYVGELARPAFQQDLTYTLPGSAGELVFRDLTLQVLEANSSTIRYRVDRGL
ncbi:MAG TPA: hypothetical protein VM617_03240 [Thermoanaerobaculia bacterium]|nr:hypothetical protein [Thermoanaerobaculia bacterium]